ncbi:hypothetical protein GCM10010407_09840 [Rarobacter incanus]
MVAVRLASTAARPDSGPPGRARGKGENPLRTFVAPTTYAYGVVAPSGGRMAFVDPNTDPGDDTARIVVSGIDANAHGAGFFGAEESVGLGGAVGQSAQVVAWTSAPTTPGGMTQVRPARQPQPTVEQGVAVGEVVKIRTGQPQSDALYVADVETGQVTWARVDDPAALSDYSARVGAAGLHAGTFLADGRLRLVLKDGRVATINWRNSNANMTIGPAVAMFATATAGVISVDGSQVAWSGPDEWGDTHVIVRRIDAAGAISGDYDAKGRYDAESGGFLGVTDVTQIANNGRFVVGAQMFAHLTSTGGGPAWSDYAYPDVVVDPATDAAISVEDALDRPAAIIDPTRTYADRHLISTNRVVLSPDGKFAWYTVDGFNDYGRFESQVCGWSGVAVRAVDVRSSRCVGTDTPHHEANPVPARVVAAGPDGSAIIESRDNYSVDTGYRGNVDVAQVSVGNNPQLHPVVAAIEGLEATNQSGDEPSFKLIPAMPSGAASTDLVNYKVTAQGAGTATKSWTVPISRANPTAPIVLDNTNGPWDANLTVCLAASAMVGGKEVYGSCSVSSSAVWDHEAGGGGSAMAAVARAMAAATV